MIKYFLLLLLIACIGVYPALLPDSGGNAVCAEALGWRPELYGADFQKQYLPNGVIAYSTCVYRYKISHADFRVMCQELSKKGWRFDEDEKYGMELNGSVTNYYYPMFGKVVYGYTSSLIVTLFSLMALCYSAYRGVKIIDIVHNGERPPAAMQAGAMGGQCRWALTSSGAECG